MFVLCTLNQEVILMSDANQFRDWRGILAYAPLDPKFKKFLKTAVHQDRMKTLLYQWMEVKNNNIYQLQQALQLIDRFDIYEDTLECFQKDAEVFREKSRKPFIDRSGAYIITTLDRNRFNRDEKLVIYDAFLMYSEADEDFAALIMETLEKLGMLICIKNHFLGGIPFEHEAAMTLIAKRCRRVIIIVSKDFSDCPADTFMAKYAQHIGIEQSSRKLVPCLREECEIPSNLKTLFHLKYYKDGKLFDFWQKLYESVAYDASEKDLNDKNEFECFPYKEYTKMDVPKLPKKNMLMLPPIDSSHYESGKSSEITETISYLGPNPPTESPNNSSVILTTKKKVKNPIKRLSKYFGKKQKQKVPSEPLY